MEKKIIIDYIIKKVKSCPYKMVNVSPKGEQCDSAVFRYMNFCSVTNLCPLKGIDILFRKLQALKYNFYWKMLGERWHATQVMEEVNRLLPLYRDPELVSQHLSQRKISLVISDFMISERELLRIRKSLESDMVKQIALNILKRISKFIDSVVPENYEFALVHDSKLMSEHAKYLLRGYVQWYKGTKCVDQKFNLFVDECNRFKEGSLLPELIRTINRTVEKENEKMQAIHVNLRKK